MTKVKKPELVKVQRVSVTYSYAFKLWIVAINGRRMGQYSSMGEDEWLDIHQTLMPAYIQQRISELMLENETDSTTLL